ncbi:MAG: hypothetical protein A2Z31_10470 [candidate division NC10 bacterium RBG_16_65_8]|nr:MAG: hypothetical protein A2Z31_10470 [candidate division NC10 bacterium RBG_16_65_8]
MAVGAYVLVGALLIAGLAGSLLPFLPGTPLILAAALVHALATDFNPIGAGRLMVLAGLTALAYVLDYVAGAVGAKKFGGSVWAVVGALVGGVVGLFFGPPGLLIGPVVGAVAGELLKSGEMEHSLKAGFGALVGMVVALLARFALAFTMVGLFLWWLWRR